MDNTQWHDGGPVIDGLVDLLNSNPYYRKTVEQLGYNKITINVLEEGKEFVSWTSFNDAEGYIIHIERDVTGADVTANVERWVLEEIIARKKYVNKHPIRSAFSYEGHFDIDAKQKREILATLVKSPRYIVDCAKITLRRLLNPQLSS